MAQPTLTLIRNDADSGPGRLLTWAAAAGVAVRQVRADQGEPVPADADGIDGLVLLGGGLLPDDDAKAPWLADERALVASALRHDVPVLGICLGGQLLAHVGGGRVEGDHGLPERGVTELTLRPEAAGDALLGELAMSRATSGAPVIAVESHRDQMTVLPEGAVWLASSARTPHQAFRLGERAWGLQWHPESSAERVAQWDRKTLREQGFDPDEVVRVAQERDEELAQTWGPVFGRFLSLL
ncbi:type 1 glutamine amidotransferase [Flexivirga sp. ID2601S]|uniref:Type 1 glutamine amidotransferase n=1 Tax=Flexivirga aerilata TaxID=1656889 RepID=A0A849AF67_9MICO|nr:type 1 glutamine amidotransferase [Flexivirga aerilata]NNG39494.1 type 1 glutamine amidotransferase [Flexivirga aerilata]